MQFDSLKEGRRYGQLRMLERAGEIRNLRLQTRHPLTIDGATIAVYVADFDYEERVRPQSRVAGGEPAPEVWQAVTEDVKGGEATQTDVFKLKAKIFAVNYGRKVRVT